MQKPLLSCGAVLVLASSLPLAQSPYATGVVTFVQGPGGGIFDTANVLGGPLGAGLGAGSLDVLTLGEGGSVTLSFDVAIQDGPGADLTVFENGFQFGAGSVFAEVAFVEVSTDGVAFARFSSSYAPPAGGGTPMGTFGGLAGGSPVIANVAADPTSPFDPARSGGDALDLAALAGDPLVVSGAVDLGDIRFVRLVDVAAGDVDTSGAPIAGGASADIDAVVALHHDQEAGGGPVCDLEQTPGGFLKLRVGDPDGFFDLDPTGFASSVSLLPLAAGDLLSLFHVTAFDGKVAELTSHFPVTGTGLTAVLAVSARDLAGSIAGDQLAIQG